MTKKSLFLIAALALAGVAIAMCAGLGLSYLLARRILEPVEQLDRAAAEVARQNHTIEVGVRGEDEMGRLAQTLNTMCAAFASLTRADACRMSQTLIAPIRTNVTPNQEAY
jgi:nitrate/nitrite-specific signal transduction histidine kinase